MNAVKLPIIKPDIHGYLCNAYPLSVAMQHQSAEAWFYSNYIQLICAGNFPEGKFFSFYTSNLSWYDFFLSCPLINYQQIDYRFLDKYEDGLIGFICDSIHTGQYVYLYVDESYISHKKAYKKYPLPHEMLIFGYDKENRKFHVSGYNADIIFGEYEVNFEEFLLAFNNCDKTKNNRHYISLLEYNEKHTYRFDINLVIQSLTELKDSLNSSFHFRSLSPPSNWIYGLSIYDHIIRYLEYEIITLTEKIDVRIFHTLWEHKNVMVGRLKYMKENKYLNHSEKFIEKYTEIESISMTLRSIAMMYNLNDNPARIGSLIEKLKELKQMEESILSELIVQLEQMDRTEILQDHYYL
ncbi:hypothetical protein [Paenibacillus wenxiniae]|uniref:Butirosin biosynthesis protein H N-terminal domain-containing protein n=1 Tax=Paenibacillus wenxiniae TaxID=1636843 RepID=A0ABW4RKE4_9BACL